MRISLGGVGMGRIARQACSGNKQGAQSRAPQGCRGQQVCRVAVIKAHDARRHKQGGYKAPQQKAACAAKPHDGAAKGAQRKDEGAGGPKRKIAYAPAKAGQKRQQCQRRARQRKQHKLRVEQGRAAPCAHEMTPHMGQQHEGQTRRKHGHGLIECYVPRAVSGHAKRALNQGNAHIQGCPHAPLASFRKAAQEAQQHYNAKGQQGRSARKAAPVGGSVLRGAQGGRKPDARQTVKANITGNGLCPGLGQQQNIALGGLNLAPLNAVGNGAEGGLVQDWISRNIRPHVQQYGL